jgi:hypothetical protein
VVDTLDPTAVSGMNLGDLPDIGLDTELNTDSQPFLGVLVIDQYEPNYNKDGWQWHFGVRPIDFAVKGETGCFHAKANISTSPQSKMGMMLKAFSTVRGKEKTRIGKGELLGFTAVFIRRTVDFGTAPDGTARTAQVILPVRKATEEEAARAAGAASVSQENAAVQAGTPTTPAELSDADIKAISDVIVGKTPAEFQMAALTSGLSADLMSLVLSGKALSILTEKGIVSVGDEGKIVAAEAALI